MNKLVCFAATVAAGVCVCFNAFADDATILYVDRACPNPTEPYATLATASTNLALAVAYARANDGAFEIRVAKGSYAESNITLDKAIGVVGETGNPQDVTISHATSGTRAFVLNNADAAVKNLTISGPGAASKLSGGHVSMSNGTVENCIITGGTITGARGVNGGNVYISGGKLLSCQILNGSVAGSGSGSYNYSFGGGIWATGGLIDSCLVKGNTVSGNSHCRGIYVSDGAAKLVNCTIVKNGVTSSTSPYGNGIYLGNDSARVVNTIIYGNGDSATAQYEFGNDRLGLFSHCASSVTNSLCATWQLITDDDFTGYNTGDYSVASTSPLVDAGTTNLTYYPSVASAKDVAGSPRVSGKAIDIGCYEIDQSKLSCGGYPSTYGYFEGSNIVFSASSFGGSGTITYKWDFGNGVVRETQQAEYTYAYPSSGLYTVRLAVSDDDGSSWTNWVTIPTMIVITPKVMYVDPICDNPTYPYRSKETAANTILAALNALTNNISGGYAYSDGAVVCICAGSITETGVTLKYPITITGDTDDPADVTLVDNTAGKRAFTLSNSGAKIKNLTISGTGISTDVGRGGHVNMTAGTLENCIITGGKVGGWSGYGGNVYMTGGRLVHCRVLNGKAAGSQPGSYNSSLGAGVYASGGIIENCLVKGGSCTGNGYCGGIYLAGAAQVVNCTVAANASANGTNADSSYPVVGIGIHVGNSSAKVVNSVFHDNGGTAAAEFSGSNLGRFFYCASSVTNSSCATWKVVTDDDFADVFNGDYHIVQTSCLVDTGTESGSYYPTDAATVDMDGSPRISGVTVDIGCYEINQSKLSCGGYPSTYGAILGSNVVFTAAALGGEGTITYKWDFGNGVVRETQQAEYTYAYPASGLFSVRIAASGGGGSPWTDWNTLPVKVVVAPKTMYVDAVCANPTYPYATKPTAANTITDAFAALTNNISGGLPCVDGAVVRICAGTVTDSGLTVNNTMTVTGDTGNPADITIVDSVAGKRAFTVNHSGAMIRDLTISGTGLSTFSGNGGHVYMTAGMIENCIIDGGVVKAGRSYGGNVYMTGGRLVRTQILNGKCGVNYSDSVKGYVGYGGGISAIGGTIENCLVMGNAAFAPNVYCGGIYINGAVTVANCTVVGNSASGITTTYDGARTCGVGIDVRNASTEVVNSIFYGNGGTAAHEFGASNLGRFFHCASWATNTTGTACRVIDETAFVNYAARNVSVSALRPKAFAGNPLLDGGCTFEEYAALAGGLSDTDLVGHERRTNNKLDIGCLEANRFGTVLRFK